MIFSKGRKIGKQFQANLIVSIMLQRGNSVYLVSNEYPKNICDFLDGKEIEYEIEPSYITYNLCPVYDEEGIIGFEAKERELTGYIFKPKKL